jgi:hypothetical protein
MGIIPQYYGGHTAAATSTTGGNGVSVGTTIQTIVKVGILKTVPADYVGQNFMPMDIEGILPTDVQYFGRSLALFPDGIPTYYELFYNGQWYNKGQLNEVKLSVTSFEFPQLTWATSDILEMKYQLIV